MISDWPIFVAFRAGLFNRPFPGSSKPSDSPTSTKRTKSRKIRAKFPELSVVGVFLNRFDASYVAAKNAVSITFCTYILLATFTPLQLRLGVVYFLSTYLITLIAQSFVTNYRVKKGYYLNNESETRELIDFIRANSDDIDFTGTNLKIVSNRDLEDVVFSEMSRVPLT